MPAGRMTNGIAAIIFVAFLLQYFSGQLDYAAIVGGFIPARIDNPQIISDIIAVPAWLTPLSCTFIHAGWMHVGFNLLILIFCGRFVEHVLDKMGLLILYIVGAYAACLVQWAIDPSSVDPMVGASGAISAIMATYALMYSQQKVRAIGPFSANMVRIGWLAMAWTILQLMIGVATTGGINELGRIAIFAHIGGFMGGLLITRPLLHWRFRKGPRALS